MGFLWFLIIFYALVSVSLYKVFEKAGVAPTKALIPGVNFAEWCKIIGQKPTHALWLLVPIVNIFIFSGMAVDLMRSFGNYKFWQSAFAVVLNPIANFWLGSSADQKYIGPTLVAEREYAEKLEAAAESGNTREFKKLSVKNPYHKSQAREWVEAIVFAVFAAAFIRMFLIEAYVIPTSSMEGSLMVGDYLFVSKAHYGIRTPRTIAMVPLLHKFSIIQKETVFMFFRKGHLVFMIIDAVRFRKDEGRRFEMDVRRWQFDRWIKKIIISSVVWQLPAIRFK